MEWLSPEYDSHILLLLRDILGRRPEIEGIAVVTTDGLPVASILPTDVTQDRIDLVAPACAEAASLANNLTLLLGRGQQPGPLFIRGAFGYASIVLLTAERLLIALYNSDANFGPIFLDGLPRTPFSPSPDPIFPRTPPKRLVARAKPEFDDPE
jgi:uncharacterized protein